MTSHHSSPSRLHKASLPSQLDRRIEEYLRSNHPIFWDDGLCRMVTNSTMTAGEKHPRVSRPCQDHGIVAGATGETVRYRIKV